MIKIIHEKDRRGNFLNVIRRKYVISLQLYFRGREGFVKLKKKRAFVKFSKRKFAKFPRKKKFVQLL